MNWHQCRHNPVKMQRIVEFSAKIATRSNLAPTVRAPIDYLAREANPVSF